MILSLLLCILINKKSKKEFVVYGDKFEYLNRKFLISQIIYCEYYVCKWYAIPIVMLFYKQQWGGMLHLKLNTGKKIEFRILYSDYKKLIGKIPNIVEK